MKLQPFWCKFCRHHTTNRAPCHFMQSHIHKVYACLAVTCHLHFWQNDWDLLHATAVTWGWNGYRNKSQHRKSTLEKKILPPLLQGFEPTNHESGALTTKLTPPPPHPPPMMDSHMLSSGDLSPQSATSTPPLWILIIHAIKETVTHSVSCASVRSESAREQRIVLYKNYEK